MQIALSLIKPSPRPVRTSWDEEKLEELAQSIKEQGLIVPVKVRPLNGVKGCTFHGVDYLAASLPRNMHDPDEACFYCGELAMAQQDDNFEWLPDFRPFELVYGHRRVEASRRAGLEEIEAIVEGVDDTNALIQALIENVQREDMTPIEIAKALVALKDETGWSNEEIERRGIMAAQSIGDYLTLMKLPNEIQQIISRGEIAGGGGRKPEPGTITPYHVRIVEPVPYVKPSDRTEIYHKAAEEGLTAAQTRRVAESVAAAPSEEAKKKLLDWEYSPTIHDPELIKSRAKEYGAHDPMYREPTPRHDQPWKETPEVAAAVTGIIEGAKRWQTLIQEVRKMVEIGKMSPEARRFAAHRVRQLADMLAEWARELEG